jgi:hypothetical protein
MITVLTEFLVGTGAPALITLNDTLPDLKGAFGARTKSIQYVT